jgi:hypothetical protein
LRAGPARPSLSVPIALACALAIVSCGSKPPEVAAVEWRVESRSPKGGVAEKGAAEKGGSYESLSVFGSIKDDDGIGNISELWILNDAEALAWKLTDADWTKAVEGGDNWIGASALAMPELGPMPRGEYRLIAIDAAGQRAELPFTVAGEFPAKVAPSASFAKGLLSIRSEWTETLALAFDGTGALLAAVPAPRNASSLSEAFGAAMEARVASACAYGYEPALKMGAFSPRIATR